MANIKDGTKARAIIKEKADINKKSPGFNWGIFILKPFTNGDTYSWIGFDVTILIKKPAYA